LKYCLQRRATSERRITSQEGSGSNLECGSLETVSKPVNGAGFQPLSLLLFHFWGSAPGLEFIHLNLPGKMPRLRQADSRNAAASQSPGLAALFAAYPGEGLHLQSTLKGLDKHTTLSGLTPSSISPRVGRKKRGQPWALLFCPFGAGVLRQPPSCRQVRAGFSVLSWTVLQKPRPFAPTKPQFFANPILNKQVCN
jgi:hypothetical protein